MLLVAPFITAISALGIVFISGRTKPSGTFNKWCAATTFGWRAAIKFACYLLFSTLLFLWPLLLLTYFAGISQASGEVTGIFILIVSILGIILFNAGIATYEASSISQYSYLFVVAASTIFILFSTFGILNFIPNRVVEIYGFGNVENASLVVDEVGCTIAKQYGLEETDEEEADSDFDQPPCLLQDVNIHSRLGDAYYVEIPSDTSAPFTIPRQHVLSWSPPELKK